MNQQQPVTPASAALLLAGVLLLSVALAAPCVLLTPLPSPAPSSAASATPGGKEQGKADRPVEADKQVEQPAEAPLVLTCDELAREYHASPAAARDKYRGKLLRLAGVAKYVRDGAGGSVAEAVYPVVIDGNTYHDRIVMHFPGGLGGLRVGEPFAAVGRCGERGPGRSLNINGCRLVE